MFNQEKIDKKFSKHFHKSVQDILDQKSKKYKRLTDYDNVSKIIPKPFYKEPSLGEEEARESLDKLRNYYFHATRDQKIRLLEFANWLAFHGRISTSSNAYKTVPKRLQKEVKDLLQEKTFSPQEDFILNNLLDSNLGRQTVTRVFNSSYEKALNDFLTSKISLTDFSDTYQKYLETVPFEDKDLQAIIELANEHLSFYNERKPKFDKNELSKDEFQYFASLFIERGYSSINEAALAAYQLYLLEEAPLELQRSADRLLSKAPCIKGKDEREDLINGLTETLQCDKKLVVNNVFSYLD